MAEVCLQRVVPRFRSSLLLQAPKGHYVELNFTLKTSNEIPCFDDNMYLEFRDGYDESANLLGRFCGRNISGIVRSSGQNLWLRKSDNSNYLFRGLYRNKTTNTKGKYWDTEISPWQPFYIYWEWSLPMLLRLKYFCDGSVLLFLILQWNPTWIKCSRLSMCFSTVINPSGVQHRVHRHQSLFGERTAQWYRTVQVYCIGWPSLEKTATSTAVKWTHRMVWTKKKSVLSSKVSFNNENLILNWIRSGENIVNICKFLYL